MQNLLRKPPSSSPIKDEPVHTPKVVDEKPAPVVEKVPPQEISYHHKKFDFKKYFLFIPLLFISLILFTLLRYIFQHIEPSFFKDVFLPGSYSPIIILIWFTVFFFFTYILMNVRRGIFFAFFLSLIFSFQIHHMLSVLTFFISLIPFLLLEITLTWRKTNR